MTLWEIDRIDEVARSELEQYGSFVVGSFNLDIGIEINHQVSSCW